MEEALMKEIKSLLYLESKRGKRVGAMRNCVECGFRGKGYWRYSESNKGVVFLCDVCKPIVYERSKGIVGVLADHNKEEGSRATEENIKIARSLSTTPKVAPGKFPLRRENLTAPSSCEHLVPDWFRHGIDLLPIYLSSRKVIIPKKSWSS